LPWIPILWAIEKAYVIHQLNLPYEDHPLILLKKLMDMSSSFLEARPGNPGVFNAIGFMLLVNDFELCFLILKIIPRSTIPNDLWNFCINILNDRQYHYPGLMLLMKYISVDEERIVQLDDCATEKSDSDLPSPAESLFEDPLRLTDFFINTDADIEALLNENV
jgi:hypothetical protein